MGRVLLRWSGFSWFSTDSKNLTELRCEKFESFDPSPIAPFNSAPFTHGSEAALPDDPQGREVAELDVRVLEFDAVLQDVLELTQDRCKDRTR